MQYNDYIFHSSVLKASELPVHLSAKTLLTNGKFTTKNDETTVFFDKVSDNSEVFIITVNLEKNEELSGAAARLILEKWERIDYIAIGLMAGKNFNHIKINHIRQDVETLIEISLHSLAYKIQNGFSSEVHLMCDSIRIFIKGVPRKEKAIVSLREVIGFNEGINYNFWLIGKDKYYSFNDFIQFCQVHRDQLIASTDLRNALIEYDKRVFPEYLKSANYYIEGNGLSLTKIADLPLNLIETPQYKIQENNTIRYAYQGLNHINALLMAYETSSDDVMLFAARELFSEWEKRNFFSDGPEDERYTWYDHGTAERLLVMIRFWSIGVEKLFDVRFMGRLLFMIKQHADLLANESFYARNQNYRYHNHALFQDIALLVSSIAFPFIASSSVWEKIAIERMKDQFNNLVILENDVAIFKENSPGYHDGTLRIVSFIKELSKISNNAEVLNFYTALEEKMFLFSKIMHYPGGRQPSIGDTYRFENSEILRTKSLTAKHEKGFYSFSKSGYIVAKGEDHESYWQLTLTAASLTQTHKHEDNLSFTLFFDGIEWFVDPSFFSHQYQDLFPAYFRSAKAHNSIIIEDFKYSIDAGKTNLVSTFDQNYFSINGQHNAYETAIVSRKVQGSLNELSIEFQDSVETQKAVVKSAYIHWHLGESVTAKLTERGIVLSSSLSTFSLLLEIPDLDLVEIICGNEDNAPEGWIGSGFCMTKATVVIKYTLKNFMNVNWKISKC